MNAIVSDSSAAGRTELAWRERLAADLAPGTVARADEPLASRTTLRVGGPADFYLEPANEADLARALRFCAERGLPWFLLGRGSNLLVRDGGIRGLVICLAHPCFSEIVVEGDRLHCGAGARLKAVAGAARRQGLAGLEFLEGIPGSLGGALRMNAGAMGSWLFDVVQTVRLMDGQGEVAELPASQVGAGYREGLRSPRQIALRATLVGRPDAPMAIGARMEALARRRRAAQPVEASAGCVFKNPATIPAGRLIEELGLKGARGGGAMVSPVHANFIVNTGGATAREVLDLIELIRDRARTERGIELETEVRIVGED